MRTLKIVAALALLPMAARAEEVQSIEAEAARVISAAVNGGQLNSWDDVRVAMPRSVNWHLAPPDDSGARVFRRSGWIAVAGDQAGVAVCGGARSPEFLAVRLSGEDQGVLQLLRASGLEITAIDSAAEAERFSVRSASAEPQWLQRAVSCTPPGSRAGRSCHTQYTLTIQPHYRSAATARECRAP